MKAITLMSVMALSHAFTVPQSSTSSRISTTPLNMMEEVQCSDESSSRRGFFASTASAFGLMGVLATIAPEDAMASGGATAGKYTLVTNLYISFD